MAANPLVNLGWTRHRACVRMRNLDRRRQMANVNDLESMLLKVCNSFPVEVFSAEGSMDQCDSFCFQRAEARSRRRCRHWDRHAIRMLINTTHEFLFSGRAEKITAHCPSIYDRLQWQSRKKFCRVLRTRRISECREIS